MNSQIHPKLSPSLPQAKHPVRRSSNYSQTHGRHSSNYSHTHVKHSSNYSHTHGRHSSNYSQSSLELNLPLYISVSSHHPLHHPLDGYLSPVCVPLAAQDSPWHPELLQLSATHSASPFTRPTSPPLPVLALFIPLLGLCTQVQQSCRISET